MLIVAYSFLWVLQDLYHQPSESGSYMRASFGWRVVGGNKETKNLLQLAQDTISRKCL